MLITNNARRAAPEFGWNGGGVGPILNTIIARLDLVSVGAEAGNTIRVTFQLRKFDGSALLAALPVRLIVYETNNAGAANLASDADFTAVATGTLLFGTGSNDITVLSSAAGLIALDVFDLLAETVFVTGLDAPAPVATPFVLAQRDQATLTFT